MRRSAVIRTPASDPDRPPPPGLPVKGSTAAGVPGNPRVSEDGAPGGKKSGNSQTWRAPADGVRKKMEDLTALAVNHQAVGLWEMDLKTGNLWLDLRCREFLGFGEDEPAGIGSCLGRIHREDRAAMVSEFRRSMPADCGGDWNFECRVQHPDHGSRWIHGLGLFERDGRGLPTRILGMAMVLRHGKVLEVSGRASEERYRKLFESISDAVVIVNMEGDILQCNQPYLEMTGYTRGELRRMTYRDLTPAKWHDFEADIVARQIIPCGHSDTYEKEYMRKDGSVLPVELRTFLIRDHGGRPAQMWAIVRDISERKASESMILEWNKTLESRVAERTSALRQSESRFRQLAEATFEAIAICENGIILDGNSLLASMFGRDLADLIGQPIDALVAGDCQQPVVEKLLHGKDVAIEFNAVRADGTILPVQARSKGANEPGRKVRIIAIRDLTDAKAAESRIAAQRDELDKVHRLALISEVAAGIVHQIGQPLSSMGINLMTAINGLNSCKLAPCHSMSHVLRVESDIDRMRNIVVHMRSLGDPERAERESCQLNQVITGVLPILRSLPSGSGMKLKFNPGENLPCVEADSIQLAQMVLNLVKNAFDACAKLPPGRGIVHILTGIHDDQWVEMIVRDNGTGIAPEVEKLLFTPFFSTKSDGLGVGLRLCRTIIEAHGGSISCSNNDNGVGASFRVRLPAHKVSDNDSG